MTVPHLVRWLALLPAIFAAWYAVFIAGALLVGALGMLCPPDEDVSGLCLATWYRATADGLILLAAAAWACAVVLAAAWTAPSHKPATATIAYLVGAAVAVTWAIELRAWPELAAALAGGAAVLAWVYRRARPEVRGALLPDPDRTDRSGAERGP